MLLSHHSLAAGLENGRLIDEKAKISNLKKRLYRTENRLRSGTITYFLKPSLFRLDTPFKTHIKDVGRKGAKIFNHITNDSQYSSQKRREVSKKKERVNVTQGGNLYPGIALEL